MNKQNFLNGFSDNKIRNDLYGLFTHAEAEAKCFAADFGNWVPISRVVEDSYGWMWCLPQECHIKVNSAKLKNGKEFGAIFHEVFHSAFHNSPLWKSDILQHNGYGQWGDGFCDAFRYYMEESKLPNKYQEFYRELRKNYIYKEPEKILQRTTSNATYDAQYAIPAAKIIEKAGNYSGFKALWKQLNQQWQKSGMTDDCFLETYFKYPMKQLQRKYDHKIR